MEPILHGSDLFSIDRWISDSLQGEVCVAIDKLKNPNGDLQKIADKCASIPVNKRLPASSGCYNSGLKLVRDAFRQLASTVAWVHENGVCHLDLSLEIR